jgi:glycosyltransferase involved in cell wall biosynthesis
MNILIWHVHGSWTTSFVQGDQTYLVPVVPDRGADGHGRARTWEWPQTVIELGPEQLADAEIDVVVVQSERELELAYAWLGGRCPGRDVPLIWLEHNTPQGRINEMRHPARDRCDVSVVVHVTATNALFWDTGTTPTIVIEHGGVDPGPQWTGERAAVGVVVNEPVRRGRVTGTDLIGWFGQFSSIDVFGMGVEALAESLRRPAWLSVYEDVPQEAMQAALATRRCYLHPFRWTSLGLALIEAMMLGMPVVALATTAVPDAVPAGCGIVSNDLCVLRDGIARLAADDEMAACLGEAARIHATERFALDRFLAEWDELLDRTGR